MSAIRQNGHATVSVIGSRGFIGRHLTRRLVAGGVPVEQFHRQRPFHDGDRLAAPLMRSDVVYYMASRINPAVAEADPDRVAQDHRAFCTLTEGLRETGHRPVVVVASSGGTVYDPDLEPPYSERSPTRTTSAYGAARLHQELELASSSTWTTPVILRLANVYGPGQRTSGGYGVIGHWLDAIDRGEPLRMLGDGSSRRDYVHVQDVVSAMVAIRERAALLRATRAPTTLNIGSGGATSLSDLHHLLETSLDRRIPVEHTAARAFDRPKVWLDVGRAGEALGWQPTHDIADGIADTVAAHLASRETVARAS